MSTGRYPNRFVFSICAQLVHNILYQESVSEQEGMREALTGYGAAIRTFDIETAAGVPNLHLSSGSDGVFVAPAIKPLQKIESPRQAYTGVFTNCRLAVASDHKKTVVMSDQSAFAMTTASGKNVMLKHGSAEEACNPKSCLSCGHGGLAAVAR